MRRDTVVQCTLSNSQLPSLPRTSSCSYFLALTVWAILTVLFIIAAWLVAYTVCYLRISQSKEALRSFTRRTLRLLLLLLYFAYMCVPYRFCRRFSCSADSLRPLNHQAAC